MLNDAPVRVCTMKLLFFNAGRSKQDRRSCWWQGRRSHQVSGQVPNSSFRLLRSQLIGFPNSNAGAWFGAGATMDQQITASTPQEWVRTVSLRRSPKAASIHRYRKYSIVPARADPALFDTQYELNTVGPIFFTKALLPLLSKGELKKVVNISSFLGKPDFHKATDGQFAFVSYSVAKGALDFATLKFQQE